MKNKFKNKKVIIKRGGQNVEWHFVESQICSLRRKSPLKWSQVKLPMAFENITSSKVILRLSSLT
jgi:hypothetical protein